MPRPLPPSRGARGQDLGLEGCGELLCNEVWVGVAWLSMLVSSEVSSTRTIPITKGVFTLLWEYNMLVTPNSFCAGRLSTDVPRFCALP